MSAKPRVTASHVTEAISEHQICQRYETITPGVEVHLDFTLHDHKEALRMLDLAVEDVRSQVADTQQDGQR